MCKATDCTGCGLVEGIEIVFVSFVSEIPAAPKGPLSFTSHLQPLCLFHTMQVQVYVELSESLSF